MSVSSDSCHLSGLMALSPAGAYRQGESSYWATIIKEKHLKMSSTGELSKYALKGRNKYPLKFIFFPFIC